MQEGLFVFDDTVAFPASELRTLLGLVGDLGLEPTSIEAVNGHFSYGVENPR